jgi:alpha-N-arabinofuranosidase
MKKLCSLVLLVIVSQLSIKSQTTENRITINASEQEYEINRDIYGQFSEHLGHLIYGGIWVGPNSSIPNIDGIRKEIVEALKEIKVPVLRWPGGCFADEYHWMDGIGNPKDRPKMINTNWGGVTEDNSFGTHEFLELCTLIGCEPYITGNIGSGTVRELSQWVEYVNSDNASPMTDLRKKNGQEKSWGVKYWGIGNENWGCGGNMTPEYYADQVRRYGTYMHNYGENKLFKIACGPSDDDYNWTTVLMKEDAPYLSGLSLHHYSSANLKTATDFDEGGWFDIMKKTLKMKELVEKHSEIMDKYDPLKRIALVVDEWGTWYKVEPGTNPGFLYQQNTMRDAIAAACDLNIFNNHCDRVRMANIAQVVNVLQAMILTKEDKMILTPTYWVFDLYKVHQDAMMIPVKVSSSDYVYKGDKLPAVNCSASIDSSGKMHISLCNIDPDKTEDVELSLESLKTNKISGTILTAEKMNAHNTFDNPDEVKPSAFSDFNLAGNNLKVNMPPMSVVVLEIEGKVELKRIELDLKNPKQGVDYDYYKFNGNHLPNFADLKPLSSGATDNFIIPQMVSEENFALKYAGYIKIPEDGLYTFYTTSDDGSAILIDNKLVVDNDGRHAMVEDSGNVTLSAGYHKIELLFFQAGGGMGLNVSIKGPHLEKQVIPSDILYRRN